MSIVLLAGQYQHERRIRLVFSMSLGAGATTTSLYTVTSLDDAGPSPAVVSAIATPSSPAIIDLVLSADLAFGGLYRISAVGVPGDDASVTPSGSTVDLRYGVITAKRDAEPEKTNRDALLYGVDLLWNGTDFQETDLGDLERVGGTPNVTKALYRGIESNGLPWDPTYGGKIREFVDSPAPLAGTLKGSIAAQMLKDPRVRSVKIEFEIGDESTILYATPTLISGDEIEDVTRTIPNNA